MGIIRRDMDRHAFFQELAGEKSPLAFKPEHQPRIEQLRRRLGNLDGKRVFEPGCGAGPLTEQLAGWVGKEGAVLALDACEGMTARCRELMDGHAHVQVRHGRAETAEIGCGIWDLVLCFRVYPHLEDARSFLGRCREWLAPEGELVVANLEGSRELNALHARLSGVEGDVMPSGGELGRVLEDGGWRVDEVIDSPDEYFVRARPV